MMYLFSRIVFAIAIVLAVLSFQLDWRLWIRAATYPGNEVTEVSWYRPLEPVPGGSPRGFTSAPQSRFSPESLSAVTTYAEAQNSSALLILHEGDLILEKYWDGFSSNSLANGMSMTKTVVGLLMGIAIDEGHIASVRDPVQKYLPNWPYQQRWQTLGLPNAPQITLEDLLYMQSGLRNDDDTTTPFSDLVQMYLSSDVADVALNVAPEHPPGETFEYNNVNTQILSLVLESATGESFRDYLSKQLWQPLQASTAKVWLDRPQGDAKTFCCLFATARDWARLGMLLQNRGEMDQRQIISADWLRQMLQPSPLEPTYGYHIWIKARTADYPNVDTAASEPFLAKDTFYLDGRGFQRVYVIPSRRLVIVRLGEQPSSWDDAVIPNTLIRGLTR